MPFVPKTKYLGRLIDQVERTIDGQRSAPFVFGSACGSIEDGALPALFYLAKLIDFIDDVPVYGFADDCCFGMSDLEFVEEACWPPDGVSEVIQARVFVDELTGHNQHCGAPSCYPFEMVYDAGSGTWTGGPVVFQNAEMEFELECQPLAIPDERWKLTTSGCDARTLYHPGGTGPCGELYMQWNQETFDGSACCLCASITLRLTILIRSATKHWHRLARHVDTVVHAGTAKKVFAFGDCCFVQHYYAPSCCDRIPCRLYAEIESSCTDYDGAIVPIDYDPTTQNWGGSLVSGGTTIVAGFSCLMAGDLEGNCEYLEGTCGEDVGEEPCVCEEDGYEACDISQFVGAHWVVNVGCIAATSIFLSGTICFRCDCDPIDHTFDMTYGGPDLCGCTDATMRVRITP